MFTETKHDELPKLTYEETGWRKSLAIYRIAIWHEHQNDPRTADLSVNDALQKLGVSKLNNAKVSIGAVSNIIESMSEEPSLVKRMITVYKQCEKLEPYCEGNANMVLRIVHILAQHGIRDFVNYGGAFSEISGIGPKYARALNTARLDIRTRAKLMVKPVDMHITVPKCLRDRYAKMAKEDGITMSELAKKVLLDYASRRPLKK